MAEYLSPGVYVEEYDSGATPMQGVSTSTAGFVGLAERGPVIGQPQLVTSFADYKRMYGGYLSQAAYGSNRFLPYAVEQFFANGGARAYIMRAVPGDAKAGSRTTGVLKLTAANPGAWAEDLRVVVTPASKAKTQVLAVNGADLTLKNADGFNPGDVVELFRRHRSLTQELEENKQLLHDSDPDIKAMAQEEIAAAEAELPELEHKIKVLLLPKDPLDEKNTILEIRAGTGGEEAALFAADLFRMYTRYAEIKGWKVEIMSESPSDSGGYKEIICLISGDRVYSHLKFEAGTHRVQRVPATETQGRIHTSAATVAVMPEAEEVDVEIRPEDLRIDIYRASGAGGQHVNKTESAVRITHIPTGTVVTCQDERSQHKNKARAMKVLASRILAAERERQNNELSADRKAQVGSGDRSERIRTYNFPQGRCTDHRINLTLYSLDRIMEGEVEPLFEALATAAQTEALKAEAEA